MGTPTPPTHEDAVLMVQLAQWSTSIGFQDAVRVILAEDFDPDSADLMDAPVLTVCHFSETVGTLVKNGLFNRALANDWLWFEGLWERVREAALRQRVRVGEPRLYENFEALAGAKNP